MEIVRKEDDLVVFQEDSFYYTNEYTLRDMRNLFMSEPSKWKLTRFEQRSLQSDKVHYSMMAAFDSNGEYMEISMHTPNLSRRIRIDKDGCVLCDYIVDDFINFMHPVIFVAFGSVHDYSGDIKGPHINEYLASEQVFVNQSDPNDVLVNRWMLNSFFVDYLLYDESLSKKVVRYSSDDYPRQLKLNV